MAYVHLVEMASSQSLMNRIAACAALEGIDNPREWAMARMWKIAATPGWADDWSYASDEYTPEKNPDTGARPDVIGDEKILPAVQAIVAAENPA